MFYFKCKNCGERTAYAKEAISVFCDEKCFIQYYENLESYKCSSCGKNGFKCTPNGIGPSCEPGNW